MKVVHVWKDYYPPVIGGVELLISRMAAATLRAGGEVTVLTSAHGRRRTSEECEEGVRVIRVAEWFRLLSAPFCPSMPRHLSRLSADIFHLHYPNPTGELSWWLSRPRGALVFSYHGDIVRQRAALPIYGPFTHALLRAADVIMASSERQVEASPFLSFHRDKCAVVPLGIDFATYAHPETHRAAADRLRAAYGTPLVLFVGRLVYYKGLEVLLSAMRHVVGSLVIVGDGPERKRLEAMREALGLRDRVWFAGRVALPDLLDYLAAADVGVLPSTKPAETFGLSIVEMMASGIPVVCTELGTGTSFVNRDGETGLVVAPGDPNALANALNRLNSDPDLRSRMGDAGRVRARTLFTTEVMMRRIETVYERALDHRRFRSPRQPRTRFRE